MAVALDATSNAGATFTGNVSWAHTPVGTVRGVMITVFNVTASGVDQVQGVKYGGVTVPRISPPSLFKTTTEAMGLATFFLGSGLPSGPQTVEVLTTAATVTKAGMCRTFTATKDVEKIAEVVWSSDAVANPTGTLALAGRSACCVLVFLSGQQAVSGFTQLTNWSIGSPESDFGNAGGGEYTYNIVGTANVTAGWTQTSDDAVGMAIAVAEVQGPTGVLTQTLASATAVAETIVPAQGLVAYWPLNEQSETSPALDAHGDHPLTPVNTPGWTTGKVGGSRYFETPAQRYFTHPSTPDLETGDVSFSFSAWFYWYSPRWAMVLAKDTDLSRGFGLQYYPGLGLSFHLLDAGSGIVSVEDPTTHVASTWYHVTCGWDAVGEYVWLMLNGGAPIIVSAPGFVPNLSTSDFRIGARSLAANPEYFDGRIDEVAFWKKVLSAAEVAWLYNAGVGRSYAEINQRSSIGTLTQTLAGATVTAVAEKSRLGSLTVTLSPVTVTAAAEHVRTAALAQTLAGATVTTATVVESRPTLTHTVAATTLSATSTLATTAGVSRTLAGATVTAAVTAPPVRYAAVAQTLVATTVTSATLTATRAMVTQACAPATLVATVASAEVVVPTSTPFMWLT